MDTHRFQVNLGGIISLLGEHLYSQPEVFLRELLQNAVDAIRARERQEAVDEPQINFELISGPGAPATLVVEDNGIGLSEDGIHRFLATIGSSTKRTDDGLASDDFIGRFGIGLLSCFIVADEIVLVTRAVGATQSYEWRGQSDGTYTVQPTTARRTCGSTVYLRCRPGSESHFIADAVVKRLSEYGTLLPLPITFTAAGTSRRINAEAPPWLSVKADNSGTESLLAWARKTLGEDYSDAFPVRSAKLGYAGAAFLLPSGVSRHRGQAHRVYVKDMFLSERIDHLLPEWAYFIHVVVNSRQVQPTASRESLREDAALEQLRDSLAEQIRSHLLMIAAKDHRRFNELVDNHHEGLRAIAAEDDICCGVFAPRLPFETSHGSMTLREFREKHGLLRYVATVDEFRQLAALANAQGMPLINAGYVHGRDILERLPQADAEYVSEPVSGSTLCAAFDDVPLDDQELCEELARIANQVLAPNGCRVEVRSFAPEALPALYHLSEDRRIQRRMERDAAQAKPLFASMMGKLASNRVQADLPLLILNYRNQPVRDLARNPTAARQAVPMIYLQSLLMGHHPLSTPENDLLNTCLRSMITLLSRSP